MPNTWHWRILQYNPHYITQNLQESTVKRQEQMSADMSEYQTKTETEVEDNEAEIKIGNSRPHQTSSNWMAIYLVRKNVCIEKHSKKHQSQ